MLDAETRKFIKQEIARSMNVILAGQTGSTPNVETETLNDLFPGMPAITNRPVMHPYGMASRAPKGTINVVGRHGENFGNRLILGHRDKNRPQDLNEGECVLYNQYGQKIYVRNQQIQIGSENSEQQAVLGNILAEFLTNVLRAFLDANYIGVGVLGPVWLSADIRIKLEQYLETYINQNATNILSYLVFTEKGEV